jgi:O-antigen/teichoic acid export membrane protein
MKHCHSDAARKDRTESGLKRKRSNPFALIGLCCTGFCLVGLPLLGLVLSALGRASSGHGWLTWVILGVSLSLYGLGLGVSFRHHRHFGPALAGVVGAGFLIAMPAHLLPGWAEWVGMAVLVGAWFWDRRLHVRHHLILDSRVPPDSEGGPFSDRR